MNLKETYMAGRSPPNETNYEVSHLFSRVYGNHMGNELETTKALAVLKQRPLPPMLFLLGCLFMSMGG